MMCRFVSSILLAFVCATAGAVQQWPQIVPPGYVFRADTTGATEVAPALNAAIAGGATHIIVPVGKYLLAGAATVALNNVTIECQGPPPSANTPPAYGSTGAVFWMTSTTTQPFTVGAGVRIIGCTFFWPNQLGTTASPIVYPPLFTEVNGQQLTNFDVIRCRLVNAYSFLDQVNSADAFGAITLTDTLGYAIDHWFKLANVPETVTIKGMIADWSLYQNVANFAPNYYLVKYTAQNGVFIHVFGNGNGSTATSTVAVQGILFDGSVFAYNKFVWVDSTGAMSESLFHGVVDAVPAIFQMDSGGCVSQIMLDAEYWAYQWNPPAGGPGGADSAPAFVFNSPASGFNCTSNSIDIRGQLQVAQGDALDVTGAYIKTVALHLAGNGSYANSSTVATYQFAKINGSNIIFDAFGNHVEPKAALTTNRGFLITSCYQCTIDSTSFNGVYNPISIAAPTIPVSAGANNSVISPATSNIVGTGTYVHNIIGDPSNSWDLVQPATLSACGTSPTFAGNDSHWSIVVGTGATTSCTLTFQQAFSLAPRCQFSTTVAAAVLTLSAITASAITISSGATNMASGQIYGACSP